MTVYSCRCPALILKKLDTQSKITVYLVFKKLYFPYLKDFIRLYTYFVWLYNTTSLLKPFVEVSCVYSNKVVFVVGVNSCNTCTC